jgi:penicillin-binding protein 2
MMAVANEGYYYTPHIIKKIKGTAIDPKFKEKHQTIKYFKPMIKVFDVYNWVQLTLQVEGIAGKQVLRKILPKWREKSSTEGSLYFVAFAPKDNPKLPSPF